MSNEKALWGDSVCTLNFAGGFLLWLVYLQAQVLLRVRISFGPHGRVVVKARLPLCGRPVFSVGIISWSMFAVSVTHG